MLYIGSHVGFTKNEQLLGSVKEALSYGSNTFMFYTGAPQNTARSVIDDDLTKKAFELMKDNNIDSSKVIVHAPYIINLCNEEKFDFSCSFLIEEVKRVEKLGIKYLVLHPGSHVGLGIDKGISNIILGLKKVFESTDSDVTILLETMAGKGTEIGRNLEEINTIITGVNNKKLGVCLDTCHLHDSGYDLKDFDSFLDEFNHVIGINKIKCIHINDSKNIIGSHKDRHENIGFGNIGFDTLINIIYNERLKEIPKILETPYVDREYPPYKYEIEMIKKKEFNKNLINEIKNQ
ncbi:MAG: deoxyribonuclease IV [Bacilli bacterium]|nr:deoxyribonuclease IV [Bacilli bacterium]